jgi:dipeptidyl aminopeptidase/acylaminoacyl peptidase
VLTVNYRGSTGYGRRYRDRLNGQWGVYDVDDCVAGVRALAQAGRIDPARVAIRGGSAGGYTVLAALVSPGRDCFAAGASLYGISDLSALVRDTHKFESRYCEALIAPLAERPEVYVERSPITHADRLRCPVIFFQGLEDKVVPPDQTERLVQALRSKGLPTEYHAFPGEQHGFRRADTRKQVLEAELAFYGRVFGFTP